MTDDLSKANVRSVVLCPRDSFQNEPTKRKSSSVFSDTSSTCSFTSSSSCSSNSSTNNMNWIRGPSLVEKSFSYRNANTGISTDISPQFSGMNLGDVMKVTVMQEMEKLNMIRNKPLDLSHRPMDLSKR